MKLLVQASVGSREATLSLETMDEEFDDIKLGDIIRATLQELYASPGREAEDRIEFTPELYAAIENVCRYVRAGVNGDAIADIPEMWLSSARRLEKFAAVAASKGGA